VSSPLELKGVLLDSPSNKFGNYPIRDETINLVEYIEDGDRLDKSQNDTLASKVRSKKKRKANSIATPRISQISQIPKSQENGVSKYKPENDWHLRLMEQNVGCHNRFHIECTSQKATNFQLEQNKVIRDAKLENTRAKRETSRLLANPCSKSYKFYELSSPKFAMILL